MTRRVVNYTYGTGLPVLPDGSIDVRDGINNLQSFDVFMNADEDTYNQRDGGIVKTRAGAVRDIGVPRIGDFTAGCTVTARNQGVLYETDGTVYVWLGALPKVVPPASSPATTGRIGHNGWLDVGDASLRGDLASTSGGTLVKLASGKTVQQDSQQSGVVRGSDGVKYAVSGCAVRRDTTIGPNWAPVSDSAHIPINVTSIVGGVDVRVNYVGKKIGTFVAGPDESFAKDGALVGASVAADFANVSIGAPCSFSVDLATGAFEFDNHYFGIERFGLYIGASGYISITHPNIRTMLHPIIRHVAPGSYSKGLDVHYQNKISNGVTGVYLVGDVEGTISYNGTEWVVESSDQWTTEDLDFVFDNATGELTVTHPSLVGSPELNISTEYNGAPFLAMPKGVSATTFTVKFFTYSSGRPVPVTVPSSALIVRFSRGRSGIRKAPTGKLLVHLGHVHVNCDHVNYPGGNFWFNSVMQN